MTLLKSDQEKLQKGDNMPSFSLLNVDGETVSSEDFSDKAVLVIFMCNHCPYVKPKMEYISKLQDYKGVAVICINSNDAEYVEEDDYEHMQQVAEKQGLMYYLYDESQDVAKAFGAVCTPDPFLFDSKHKLVFHGRLDDAMNPGDVVTEETMKQTIDAMLTGETIEHWFNPSIGCSIKWK